MQLSCDILNLKTAPMLRFVFPGISADWLVLPVYARRVHARHGPPQQFHVGGSRDADTAGSPETGERVRSAPVSPGGAAGGDPGDVLGNRRHGVERERTDDRCDGTDERPIGAAGVGGR